VEKEKPAFIETKAGFKLYWRNFLSSAFYVWCFRTADYKFASKKLFIMEFFNCSPGFLERCHLDEREPFRALGILVADHLSVAYLADPIEEIEQVAFAGVERKVTYIKLGRGNLDQFRLTTDFLFRSAILTLSLGGFGRGCCCWRCRFLRALTLKESDDSLPKREFWFCCYWGSSSTRAFAASPTRASS
jgi:hypothetical protein